MHDGKYNSHQHMAYVIKIKISVKRRKLYNFIQLVTNVLERHFYSKLTLQYSTVLNHETLNLWKQKELPTNLKLN